MDFQNQRPRPPMHKAGDDDGCTGGWTCSNCNAAIEELPFKPTSDRPLFCRDCHRQRMQNSPYRRAA
jgi:CxxC-x17-CxxC domain-containing protein